jgi:hypothetical protein
MVATTQEKFTARMERIAEDRDVDLVIDKTYANIGTYAFQPKESFAPILAFPFDFQEGRGRFVPVIGGADPGPLGPRTEDSEVGFSGIEGAVFDLVALRVEELLDAAGATPRPDEFIRITFGREDVLEWASDSDGEVDEETALARAEEWGKQIESTATQLCSEQLCSAVLTGEP